MLIISCAPSSDTTAAPPDNPTLLATLIKDSNPAISGLSIATDNSDPASPKLTITGIANTFQGAPVTATITIDQDKGITTDPASFVVTADNLISPYSTNIALTVTFEGEAAVSYTVTTQISGAAVSDWIVTEKLSEYITISFGGQGGNLSVTDRILSISGLTNSPGAEAGMITFENLPTGFTAEPSSITLPNPTGTESATSTPNPNSFTITETDNTGNSETYTIAPIELAKLTRFTPGLHIKVAEGGTDITSSLTITEEAGNMIRIVGLTNKLGANQYTLTIEQVSEFFTTPANGTTISRTITEPTPDFLTGTGTVDRDTFELTNSGESTPTVYTLIVDFSAAAPSDWFPTANFSTYITAASFAAESASAPAFDGTTITLSGGNNFTNVPNGAVALTVGTLPGGDDNVYEIMTNGLMDPDGPGLAAVNAGSAGMITIRETANPTNKQDYPVTITLGAYRSPLTPANITATYDGTNASAITIETNRIAISGFTNKASISRSSMVTFPTLTGYTITPSPLTIPDPEGESATTTNLEITVTDTRPGGVAVPHPVAINFFGLTALSVTSADINSGNAMTVPAGTTIPITTAACELLATPTVTINGVTGGKLADTTPFPVYYDRERDDLNAMNNKITVTRRLTLEDGNNNVIGTGFAVTMVFPACTSFPSGQTGDNDSTAYVIDNAPRLELASYLVNNSNDTMPTGSANTYGASYYKITENINMALPGLPLSEVGSKHPNEMGTTGKGFVPIGRQNSIFSGTLDCARHTISGLYINRAESFIGLVGYTSNNVIQNCFLADVNITKGITNIGGLVGLSDNADISYSYVTGAVSGFENVGGLIGGNAGRVSYSYSTATVSGGGSYIGGLVGLNSSATISYSYAAGDVISTGSDGVRIHTGGLVGSMTNSSIIASYATGNVTNTGTATLSGIGGLAGFMINQTSSAGGITNSYAISSVSTAPSTAGLFLGFNSSTLTGNRIYTGVTDSYYNNQSAFMVGGSTEAAKGVGSDGDTTATTTTGLTGLSTTQLQVAKGTASGETYFTWDSNIWNFTTRQYPRLKTVVCANRQYNQDATECTDL